MIVSSIRHRLLALILTVLMLAGGAVLFQVYRDARHEVQEVFDAHLAQSARILLAEVVPYLHPDSLADVSRRLRQSEARIPEGDDEGHEATSRGHSYERKIAFQLWRSDGSLVLRSASAPLTPLSPRLLQDTREGFVDAIHRGRKWRVFGLRDQALGYTVLVGQRYAIRNELVDEISQRLIVPFAIALPVLAGLVWLAVGQGLAPLRRVAREIEHRQPDRLEPLALHEVPAEIRPLAQAINALLRRIADALERERRFTDDAAHELRTPLAAIKAQAQVALRSQPGAAQRRALEQVVCGVDRAAHVVEQLLTLARLGPDAGCTGESAVDLAQLCAETAALLAPDARNKDVELVLDTEGQAMATGDPAGLGILVRNLLHNAVHYTPPGGRVRIIVGPAPGGGSRIRILDTGPGLPPGAGEQVFERFYRGDNAAGVQGCGLGLAIAREIALRHHARLSVNNREDGPGTEAVVEFPPPDDGP